MLIFSVYKILNTTSYIINSRVTGNLSPSLFLRFPVQLFVPTLNLQQLNFIHLQLNKPVAVDSLSFSDSGCCGKLLPTVVLCSAPTARLLIFIQQLVSSCLWFDTLLQHLFTTVLECTVCYSWFVLGGQLTLVHHSADA